MIDRCATPEGRFSTSVRRRLGGACVDRVPELDEAAKLDYMRRVVALDPTIERGESDLVARARCDRDAIVWTGRRAAGFGGRTRMGTDELIACQGVSER